MLLSDRDLRKAIDEGRMGLDPFDPAMVQPSSIDVRLDRYFRVFANHRYTHIDPSVAQPDLTELIEPDGDEPFVLHPGEFVLGSTYEVVTLGHDLAARLEGKALAWWTEVPTPLGLRLLAEIRPGDQVFGIDGSPTTVLRSTPVMSGRPCWEVTFSDGTAVVADSAHQWVTSSKAEREHGRRDMSIKTTEQIAASLLVRGEVNHQLPVAGPLQVPSATLPVDPYVLGIRLGDGTTSTADVTTADAEVIELVGAAGYDVSYKGRNKYRIGCPPMVRDADVAARAASLGLLPRQREKRAVLNDRDCGSAYQVKFVPPIPEFRLTRELPGQRPVGAHLHRNRGIVDVRPINSVPVKCIEVAAADGIFLVGKTCVPTHNSSLGRLGLLTHSTAGFIDPGFNGHVTLELANVASLPITLHPGMKIGQIAVFQLTSAAEHPYGSSAMGSHYQGQRGPTPSRSWERFHRTNVPSAT